MRWGGAASGCPPATIPGSGSSITRSTASSITRPLRELKHFEQAELAPGASRVFHFVIQPERDLAFPDGDGRRILEAGEIILSAGDQTATFHVTR